MGASSAPSILKNVPTTKICTTPEIKLHMTCGNSPERWVVYVTTLSWIWCHYPLKSPPLDKTTPWPEREYVLQAHPHFWRLFSTIHIHVHREAFKLSGGGSTQSCSFFDDEYQSIQSCIEKINPLFLESWRKRKNGPLLKIESASRLLTQKAAR